jgi:hypothetical protein
MPEDMDRWRDYSVGEIAFLASSDTPIPGENHLQCKWAGPFRILATTTSTVTLEPPEYWQLTPYTVHVHKIKPYVHQVVWV